MVWFPAAVRAPVPMPLSAASALTNRLDARAEKDWGLWRILPSLRTMSGELNGKWLRVSLENEWCECRRTGDRCQRPARNPC